MPSTQEVPRGRVHTLAGALALFLCFFTSAVCLHVQQWLGAPLYWYDRSWYYSWQANIKQSTALLLLGLNQWRAPAVVQISGDSSMDGQIRKLPSGRVVHDFPDRLVLISNHQIYTDWIFLWWSAYTAGHHGDLFIVLKESIKMVPVIGPGLMFFSFIFLSRHWEADKPRLHHRLRHLSDVKKRNPMWLLIFPEGTNISRNSHPVSKKWAKKVGVPELELSLLPRSRGLQFCLEELASSTDWIYDCTLAYDDIPQGVYGQEIFSLKALFIDGRKAPLVHMYWRRFAMKDVPVRDTEAFDKWLNEQWTFKERLLKHHQQEGCFPAQNGHIKTDVRVRNLAELSQILLGVVAVLVVWVAVRLAGAVLRR